MINIESSRARPPMPIRYSLRIGAEKNYSQVEERYVLQSDTTFLIITHGTGTFLGSIEGGPLNSRLSDPDAKRHYWEAVDSSVNPKHLIDPDRVDDAIHKQLGEV